MNLTMKELSYMYDRDDFTGKDYKNVFLWQYNRVMNSPIEDLYMDDIIWSSPYTLLRIKEEIGWGAFIVASNEILEKSKTSMYPYEVNYNNFLDTLANSSNKNIYNMLTAKEVETYEALLGVKLSGNYEGISLKGKGTVDEPYQIEKPQDFNEIENAMSANFVLSKNIDMKDFTFTPVGTKNKEAFKGTLDGKGFIIQNFNINNDELDVVSMFYKTEGAKLTNLIFDSATLSTNNINSTTALLAGIALNTEIERCLVIDLNITSSSKLVGGIIGEAENVNISQAAIYGYITTEDTLAAGIAATAKNTNIENCSVISNIKSNNKVAGFVSEATDVTVTTSYSYSKLDAPNKLGLIEKNSTNSINDSYYNKTVAKINEDSDDAKTTEQFSTGDLFENWSIDSSKQKSILIWVIVAFTTGFGIAYLATLSWYNDILASANGDAAIKDLEDKIQKYIEKQFIPEKETKNQIEIVFLVDTSKQMSNTRLSVAKTMIGELSEKLYARNDVKMGLIDFSSGTTWRNRINDDKVAFKQHLAEISDTIDNNNPRAYDAINAGANGFFGSYTNMPYSFTPYTSEDDGIDRHIILFTSSKTTEADLLHKHVLAALLKYGIYVHIVNIPAKENELLSYFKELSEQTDGLIRNINVGVDENKLEQDKAKAINDLSVKITGVTGVNSNARALLLYTGSSYKPYDANLFNPTSEKYVGTDDYIILSGSPLFNKYTSDNGEEVDILTADNILNLKIPDKDASEIIKISYRAITGMDLPKDKFGKSIDENESSDWWIEYLYKKLNSDSISPMQKEYVMSLIEKELNKNTIQPFGGKDNKDYSLNNLLTSYTLLIDQILKVNPNARIWISLPMYESYIAYADYFTEPYKKIIIDGIEEYCKSAGYWDNIQGFYCGNEEVENYEYNVFDYSEVSAGVSTVSEKYKNRKNTQDKIDYGNTAVNSLVALSDYIHEKDKNFIWIPFFTYHEVRDADFSEERKNIKKYAIEVVANQTDIFDQIIVQPSTYFHADTDNVSRAVSSVQKQEVSYDDTAKFKKISNATIGFEYELDGCVNVFGNMQKKETEIFWMNAVIEDNDSNFAHKNQEQNLEKSRFASIKICS